MAENDKILVSFASETEKTSKNWQESDFQYFQLKYDYTLQFLCDIFRRWYYRVVKIPNP